MRKAILLTAAAAFLTVPAVVQGQQEEPVPASASGTIDAVAHLTAFITVSGDRDVLFQDVNTGLEENAATQLGLFTIVHSANVNLTFAPTSLVNTEEGNGTEIVPEWACFIQVEEEGSTEPDEEATGWVDNCNSESALAADHTALTGNTTTGFYVGGNIDGTRYEIGSYAGSITLTAVHNDG